MRNNEERFGANPLKQDASALEQLVHQQSLQETEKQAGTLNFIVPTEFVELPSKGKFYKAGHPLKDKETIEIKQMTAKEEDILNSRSLLKKGIALDRLIQSLIVDKTINPDSLVIEDRNAILVAARISAYGIDYDTEISCPSCGEKAKRRFNLSEGVKITEVSQELELSQDGNFQLQLPVTKWKVTCRSLNGGDEKLIAKMAESKKKNDSLNDSLLLDQIKLCVLSIEGVTERDLINRAIDTMPARDSKYLRTKYQEAIPSLKVIQPFACKSCEYEADMEVPLSTDFFWFK